MKDKKPIDNENLYTTLKKDGFFEIVIDKSTFLGYAKRVTEECQAVEFINQIKKKHSDAKHNVYAYVLKDTNTTRYSDDGEPAGTAGMPVLDVIRKSGCTDTAIVVTRYFGGTLLGAGGLVRAYSHAAKLALDEANIITYEKYIIVKLVCSYSDYSKYLSETEKFGVISDGVDFAENVGMTIAVKQVKFEDFERLIRELSFGKIVLERLGERFDYR